LGIRREVDLDEAEDVLLEPLVDGIEDSPRWAEGLALVA
jgi:hypothetical protein